MFMQLLILMNLNLHNGDGEMLISYKMLSSHMLTLEVVSVT